MQLKTAIITKKNMEKNKKKIQSINLAVFFFALKKVKLFLCFSVFFIYICKQNNGI